MIKKDKKSWDYLRAYRMDKLAHRVSESYTRLKGNGDPPFPRDFSDPERKNFSDRKDPGALKAETPCPYCREEARHHFRLPGRTFFRCLKCDLIFLTGNQTYDQVLEKYESDYFDAYSEDERSGSRDRIYDHILNLLEGIASGAPRLLDVGCGCGYFLMTAKNRGWQAVGIEPSPAAARYSANHLGLDVFNGTLAQFGDGSAYDAVTFINTLDHSAAPWKEVAEAVKHLKPNGHIYIRVPNGFLHANLFRAATKLRISDKLRKYLVFHQFSFTPAFLKILLRAHGFSLIRIKPARPTKGDPHGLFRHASLSLWIKRGLFSASAFFYTLTFGNLLLSPSLEVYAYRRDDPIDR